MNRYMCSFRCISGVSILLYVMSSPLSGVWHTKIGPDGNIVYLSFLESFVFLLCAASILAFILLLSLYIKIKNSHAGMKIGISLCNISMVMLDVIVIFCAFQGLSNKLNWGNADFILFIFSGPSIVIYIIGLFVFVYGYNETLGLQSGK